MKAVNSLGRLFADLNAWVMIAIGLIVFSVRIPLPAFEYVQLPLAISVVQTAGLIFAIYGIQMLASNVFWPQIRVGDLMREVLEENSGAAAQVLLGLLIFNGLTVIGFCFWLVTAFGGVGK